MAKPRSLNTLASILLAITVSLSLISSAGANNQGQSEPPEGSTPQIEVVSEYFSIQQLSVADGTQLLGYFISGPSQPPFEHQLEHDASTIDEAPQGTLVNFPSYSWVFGCSAVSAAMIAAWYDRGSFPNMYAGPTDGGLMPITDTCWPSWSQGSYIYPSNPLVASRNGVDGQCTKGSVEDYWTSYGSSSQDPYIVGGWTQHAWGNAIGDFMKTSQLSYQNKDGSTLFYNYSNTPEKLLCSTMLSAGVADQDGTYGRKLFYEARGYLVTDCYNQRTDNNSGGFTLANFKAEIDAGHPVLINLAGHSIVGYGYNGSTVYIRDTWDSNPAHVYSMPWGGTYQDMGMVSVSVVHPTLCQRNNKQYLPLLFN